MTLRTKTLLASTALLVAALAVFYAVSSRTLLRGFADVEDQAVRQNVERLSAALQVMLDQMDATVRDWAWWDDSYNFVATTNADYMRVNLTTESMANIGTDLIAYLDPSGRLVYGSAVSGEEMSQVALPAAFLAHLAPDRPLLRFAGLLASTKGIVLTPSAPLLVAARQILTSQQEGPVRGTLVMARCLDEETVGQLQRLIGLRVCIRRLDEDDLCAACALAAGLTAEPGGVVVQAESEDRISGYVPLNDIYGKPALVARVDQPRMIYAHARHTLFRFLIVLLGIGAACFAVAVILLEKFVVSRLRSLAKDVGRIRYDELSSHRAAVSGNDEVASVARSINTMLEILKRAHGEQLKSHTQYRGLIETTPDVVYSLSRDGTLTSLSPSFEKLTGWSPGEWIGRPFQDLVHPDDLPLALQTFQGVLCRERQPPYVLRIRRKTGDYAIGEFSSSPQIEEGQVVGEFGIARDISERRRAEGEIRDLLAESDRARLALLSILEDEKRTEEALSQSEARFREMAEMMPETIFEMDASGRLTFVNQRAYYRWGFTAEDVNIGLTAHDMIVPDEWEAMRENIRLRFTGKKGVNAYTARRKDGSTFPIEIYSTPIVHDGRPVGLRGVIIDTTGREEMHKLQVAKEAAEAASQAKSDFLAKMSHELRTPLNVVIGYSEALEDQIHGPLNEKQMQNIRDILSSGQHLLDLLNDILDLSRVEAGRMQIQLNDVNVEKLLTNSLVAIRDRAQKQNLRVELDLAPELTGLRIRADERRLRQILFNLLTNAAKFTPDGGSVILRARIVADPNGDRLQVGVADTGIGIRPEDQAQLFQKFYRVDSPFVREREGSGLGLALTREFVQLHGGAIRVHSEGESRGSTFEFEIPT